MSMPQPGDRLSVGICEDMIVWKFTSKAEFLGVVDHDARVFHRLVESCDVPALVTVLEFEDAIETAGIDGWDRTCRLAAEMGITRWAIVAGEQHAALEGALDTDALEVRTTDDRGAAVEWARST